MMLVRRPHTVVGLITLLSALLSLLAGALQRPHCMAGVVGLELANVVLKNAI